MYMIEITLLISKEIQEQIFDELEHRRLSIHEKTDIIEEVIQDLLDSSFKGE